MDLPHWISFSTQDNKELLIAAIGSFFGAVGGAYAAQRIVERANRRDGLRKEVMRPNAAIGELYSVGTTFFDLKESFVLPVRQQFHRLERLVRERDEAIAAGRAIEPLMLAPELLYEVVWPHVNLERLDKIVCDELMVMGRPPALVAKLIQFKAALEVLVKARGDIVAQFKRMARGGGFTREHLRIMLGQPDENGSADVTVRTNLEETTKATDECIHCCLLLNKDLYAHGEVVRDRFLRRFRGPVAEISKLDFSLAREKGLLPDSAQFESWEKNFIARPPVTDGRRLGKWWYAWRKAWRAVLLKPWGSARSEGNTGARSD